MNSSIKDKLEHYFNTRGEFYAHDFVKEKLFIDRNQKHIGELRQKAI